MIQNTSSTFRIIGNWNRALEELQAATNADPRQEEEEAPEMASTPGGTGYSLDD
jgi:hypothetical protein